MKKFSIFALIISIAFNVIIGAYAIKLRRYIQSDASEKQSLALDVMMTKTNIYDSLYVDSSDVVFFGDSITEGFPLNDFFGCHIKNRGIGGNTSFDLKYRLHQVAKAKKIFLMIGVNDFRDGKSPKEVFDNFRFIADSLKNKLIVQSVLPIWGRYDRLLPDIEQYNTLIKNYCVKNDITYLDLFTPFTKQNLTYDGLHLSYGGYKMWANILSKSGLLK